MLPVAAKYVTRGDLETAANRAAMLGTRSGLPIGVSPSAVLAGVEGYGAAWAHVGRYLDMVRALTEPALWEQ